MYFNGNIINIMKKRLITGLLQYIGAVVLIVCTAITVYGFETGSLPFMDASYLEARKNSGINGAGQDVEPPLPNTQQTVVTAATYIGSLPKVPAGAVSFTGVYGNGAYLAVRPMSEIGNVGTAKLDLRMGFIIKSENGAVQAVYDGELKDISSVINGWDLTYLRNEDGKPLFVKDGTHAYYENGVLVPCEYDSYNLDKGIYCEQAAYLAAYDSSYEVFKQDGFYGLRRSEDGGVVVQPKYSDVYGMSEGYCIAVDTDKRLHLYDKDGTLINSDYYGAEAEDSRAIGYYFVRNGLTRVRDGNGKELMLRTDGTVLDIPSGFTVLAYSDGAILLKGALGYGYMSSDGKWITNPDYADAKPFNEGLAVVCGEDGACGMIDLNGNTVIPTVFDSVSGSSDGVILAYAQKYGYYIINKLS